MTRIKTLDEGYEMLKRTVRTIGLVTVATMAMVGGVTGPASADSGGGCGAYVYNVRACISVASGTSNPLLLDFYVRGFSRGECRADVAIIYNNSSNPPSEYKATYVWLTRTGRFGPWSETKALAHGQGRTQVVVWNCYNQVLYVVYSPNQTW